jgi:AMP nucleosidase
LVNNLGMDKTLRIDSSLPEESLREQIESACRRMEQDFADGFYSKITVHRHWSKHNPEISGKIARPSAYRWFLRRELYRLAKRGAQIVVSRDRPRVDLSSPTLLERIDETDFDLTRKKVFLFGPERSELSIERLEHYTGTRAEDFQRYVLLTNYQMHMEAFRDQFPNCVQSTRAGVQMPALHHIQSDNRGISIVNIGVGPSNAKNLTDHLAVLRPDAILMVGHCAGVRNHQEIGDFVLASGYMRADRLLDESLPPSVPITPSFLINRHLAKVLDDSGLPYRIGAVYTTGDRNWELALRRTMIDLRASRSIAVDMESATVAANGFRYRIPSATLLCVSDKPLHGQPKLTDEARSFYEDTKKQHIAIATAAMEKIKQEYPGGFPNSDIRAPEEPLLGGPDD